MFAWLVMWQNIMAGITWWNDNYSPHSGQETNREEAAFPGSLHIPKDLTFFYWTPHP